MEKTRKLFYFIIPILVFFLFLFGDTVGAGGATGSTKNSATHVLSVKVDNGLFTMEAKDAPLGVVLKELSQKANAEFRVGTSSVYSDFLSVSLKDLTFIETIAEVLEDYNYVLKGGKNPTVIILSLRSPREEVPSENTAGPSVYTVGSEPKIGSSQVMLQSSGRPRGFEGAAGSSQVMLQSSERPHDLDECQALEFTEKDAALILEEPSENALEEERELFEEEREENRRALQDAKIKRAKAVLGMQRCSHLWEEAIEELVGIQDDRVTAILIDIAGKGKTEQLKDKAAEALWNNTADSEFKNTKGIAALKRLSNSSDPAVKMKAQQALKDYERYVRRNR